MDAPETHYYLLSFHGTFLALDAASQTLRHVPAGTPPPGVQLIIFAHRGDAATLAGERFGSLVFAPGLYPGTVSLRGGAFFASAARDGSMPVAAPQCLGWESFLPLTADDFLAVQALRYGGWGDAFGPETVRYLAKFQMQIGTHVADVRRSLPLSRAAGQLAFTDIAGTAFTLEKPAPVRTPPVIWINPQGNMGNRALQYLAAAGVQHLVPDAKVTNINLPEWDKVAPAPAPHPVDAAGTGEGRYQFDKEGMADCLRRGVIQGLRVESFTFHLDHYPPRDACRRLLGPAVGGEAAEGFGPDVLVCSIRGGEILGGRHGDYFPLPPAYYRALAERTGLELVFHGQFGTDIYAQSLRDAFPNARFYPARHPCHDFETLRRSVNIVLPISTFSWLAAWLSEARRVFVPVAGMFNPIQHPDQLYLPLDEPGFEFDLFPFAKSVDLFGQPAAFARLQSLLAEAMRPVGNDELRQIIARGRHLGRGRVLTAGFDPDFYLSRYPDAADFVRDEHGSALEHFVRQGWDARLLPLAFDSHFYLATHPDAAMAVAEGHFASPLEHFQRVGYGRGYLPRP